MPDTTTPENLWAAAHAERAALADDSARLGEVQWAQPSLCGRWSIEEVVGHLSAAVSTGRARWLVSMVGAGFDTDVHNARRLAEHRGRTPTETLQRFRTVADSTTAPTGTPPPGSARSSCTPRTSDARSVYLADPRCPWSPGSLASTPLEPSP